MKDRVARRVLCWLNRGCLRLVGSGRGKQMTLEGTRGRSFACVHGVYDFEVIEEKFMIHISEAGGGFSFS